MSFLNFSGIPASVIQLLDTVVRAWIQDDGIGLLEAGDSCENGVTPISGVCGEAETVVQTWASSESGVPYLERQRLRTRYTTRSATIAINAATPITLPAMTPAFDCLCTGGVGVGSLAITLFATGNVRLSDD